MAISMDASSSAYQINNELFRGLSEANESCWGETEGDIRDLYSDIVVDIKVNLGRYFEKELADFFRGKLTRSLMKKVFMPQKKWSAKCRYLAST